MYGTKLQYIYQTYYDIFFCKCKYPFLLLEFLHSILSSKGGTLPDICIHLCFRLLHLRKCKQNFRPLSYFAFQFNRTAMLYCNLLCYCKSET